MGWNVGRPVEAHHPWPSQEGEQQTSQGKPHVKICIPHFGNVSMEWARCMLEPLDVLAHPNFDKQVIIDRGILNLDTLRNDLVQMALKDPRTTHILFVDTDVVVEQPKDPNEAIQILLNCNNAVASGLYRAKQREGFNYAAWVRHPSGGRGYIPIGSWESGNWIHVDVIGFGFVLLKRECFEKVPYPWFEWGEPTPSEDFVFCEKLNQVGIQVRVMTDVSCSSGTSFMILFSSNMVSHVLNITSVVLPCWVTSLLTYSNPSMLEMK